jgi:hypothetical protein
VIADFTNFIFHSPLRTVAQITISPAAPHFETTSCAVGLSVRVSLLKVKSSKA